MSNDERIERCLDFFNSKLETPLVREDLEFRTWKGNVGFKDVDKFHLSAKAFEIKEIDSSAGSIFYCINIPKNEGEKLGDDWTVHIVYDQDRDFIEKYKNCYTINHF